MRSVVKRKAGELAIVIPSKIAAEASIEDGSEVEVIAERGRIIIRPPGLAHYSLADLVAQVTDENRHELVEWGPPVGREFW
jgi:antitoxin MazE